MVPVGLIASSGLTTSIQVVDPTLKKILIGVPVEGLVAQFTFDLPAYPTW